jgi:hypothetical protein
MTFLGGAAMSVFIGGVALYLVFRGQRRRNEFATIQQGWIKYAVWFLLVALELSILCNVIICVFLALIDFDIVLRPEDGKFDVLLDVAVSFFPYILMSMQLLFASVVLFDFIAKRG